MGGCFGDELGGGVLVELALEASEGGRYGDRVFVEENHVNGGCLASVELLSVVLCGCVV